MTPHKLKNVEPRATDRVARIWVHSDLQLAEPKQAEVILSTAVNDLLELGISLDAVWCLGDAHCGTNEANLQAVAALNITQLKRLNAPVYYVMGNHEMDLRNAKKVLRFPLYCTVMPISGIWCGTKKIRGYENIPSRANLKSNLTFLHWNHCARQAVIRHYWNCMQMGR